MKTNTNSQCLCDNQMCEFHSPQEHYNLRGTFTGQMRVDIIRNGQRAVVTRYKYTGKSGAKYVLCHVCHNAVQSVYGLEHGAD